MLELELGRANVTHVIVHGGRNGIPASIVGIREEESVATRHIAGLLIASVERSTRVVQEHFAKHQVEEDHQQCDQSAANAMHCVWCKLCEVATSGNGHGYLKREWLVKSPLPCSKAIDLMW